MLDTLLLAPNDSQAEHIRTETRETDSQKHDHHVKLLETWVDCQPHLPKNYEKNLLSTYLRGTKYDLEAAKRKVELFFVCKSTMGDILSVREYTNEEMQIVNNFVCLPLPRLTDEGYRVSIFHLRGPNPDLFDSKTVLKHIWKFATLRVSKEEMIGGDVYVFDAKHFSPSHVAKFLTNEMKTSIYLGQEAFCSRIRQIHIVNAPAYMDKLIGFVKVLLKEKLRKRITVDQGMSTIKKYIPEKSLPINYGGMELTSDELYEKWMKCLDEHKKWFEQQADVKLIGPVPKNLESNCLVADSFGVQGSFRQLSID